MKAGFTDLDCGTRIKTTKKWLGMIVTGEITHPFGEFGNFGAIAGIRIDKEYRYKGIGETGNLFVGDFEVIRKGE